MVEVIVRRGVRYSRPRRPSAALAPGDLGPGGGGPLGGGCERPEFLGGLGCKIPHRVGFADSLLSVAPTQMFTSPRHRRGSFVAIFGPFFGRGPGILRTNAPRTSCRASVGHPTRLHKLHPERWFRPLPRCRGGCRSGSRKGCPLDTCATSCPGSRAVAGWLDGGGVSENSPMVEAR